jgi:hypothetical protein
MAGDRRFDSLCSARQRACTLKRSSATHLEQDWFCSAVLRVRAHLDASNPLDEEQGLTRRPSRYAAMSTATRGLIAAPSGMLLITLESWRHRRAADKEYVHAVPYALCQQCNNAGWLYQCIVAGTYPCNVESVPKTIPVGEIKGQHTWQKTARRRTAAH